MKDRPLTIDVSGKAPAVLDQLCKQGGCLWKIETYLVVWSAEESTPEWRFGRDAKARGASGSGGAHEFD